MKKGQAIAIVIGFIVLWYCGAMLDFFPFTADIFCTGNTARQRSDCRSQQEAISWST